MCVSVCMCVCVSVCVCVPTLAATAFVHSPKLSYHRAIYHDFLDFNLRMLLKCFIQEILLILARLDIYVKRRHKKNVLEKLASKCAK